MAGRYDRPRMTLRPRIAGLLAAVALAAALLLLASAGAARADQAYDKVAAAYAQSGGQLDPCTFTQAELEAAIRGIPPQIRDVVPDLRRAMEDGVAAHERGDCEGRTPDSGTPGGAAAPGSTTPATTTPPVETTPAPDTPTSTTPGATDTGAAAPPPATTAPPPGAEPAPAPAGEAAAPAAGDDRDLTPLWIALIALGALLLLALATWGWARMRGWDPPWVARVRHSWGEAGYRTTSTWAEFTDWLRLGR